MAHPKSTFMAPLPGEALPIHNRPDEWKIEQGLSGGKLPILDQTWGEEAHVIQPQKWPDIKKDEAAIKAVGDPEELFQRERKGWKGYVRVSRHTLLAYHLVDCSLSFQIRGMGRVSRKEGEGSQDSHSAKLPTQPGVPDGAYP